MSAKLRLVGLIAAGVAAGILGAKGLEFGGRKAWKAGKEKFKKEVKNIAKEGQ